MLVLILTSIFYFVKKMNEANSFKATSIEEFFFVDFSWSIQKKYLDRNMNHVCHLRHDMSFKHKSLFKRHYKKYFSIKSQLVFQSM